QGRMPPLLRAFLEEIRPALEAAGDYDYAVAELDRVLRDGNGAARQRAAWRRRKNVDDVLAEIADATVR
ncbi:MAG: carboxylate-amine ligase, YbdK family, partial [Mycobacterium sp.]|nr:carboxylate-amine ligase, YbdK family [Mycobacterium sp.]